MLKLETDDRGVMGSEGLYLLPAAVIHKRAELFLKQTESQSSKLLQIEINQFSAAFSTNRHEFGLVM